jgi:hypothetical protein
VTAVAQDSFKSLWRMRNVMRAASRHAAALRARLRMIHSDHFERRDG